MDCPLRKGRHHKRYQNPVMAPPRPDFKLCQGRTGSPGLDPPPRHSLPEWGSTKVEDGLVKGWENQAPTTVIGETNSTRPQAGTQTSGSDIRTVEKQSDLDTTPLTTANKHYHGWLIPITINQVSTLALQDTGAMCTMIGRPLYETYKLSSH